jgi:hypothetical protein
MNWKPLFSLLLILFLGCTEPEPPIGSSLRRFSYYEIVWQDYDCSGGPCFIEYVVTENGTMLKKEIRDDIYSKPEITLSRVSSAEAKSEIAFVEKNMPEGDYASCETCKVYHLFYGGLNSTKWHAVRDEDASSFVRSVKERTERLFLSSEKQGTFFMHLIYKKYGRTKDFHIFKDGAVIMEEFGERSGELLGASAWYTNPKKFEGSLAGFFDSEGDARKCAALGFEYSYIEAIEGDEYGTVDTCGAGSTAADKLFDKIIGLVEE